MAIRKLRIIGGPRVTDTHVYDAETGTEIYVRSIEFKWEAGEESRCYAKIEVAVESFDGVDIPAPGIPA